MCHKCTTINIHGRRRSWWDLHPEVILLIIFISVIFGVTAFVNVVNNPTCDTDYECSQTLACKLKPGCDGGPYSGPLHIGWRA